MPAHLGFAHNKQVVYDCATLPIYLCHLSMFIKKVFPRTVFVCILTVFSLSACAEKAPTYFTNPIIPGGNPDPSICRVGEYYYIANSSFIWFPGVPIRRSKDLVNWELIGYALPTPKHIDINDNTGVSGGLWAPTIRYHDGLFYLTVTQKRSGSSVLVTAKNPAGPWSEPITLHSQDGIDGSLLFDDDGRIWYTWSEAHEILLREFDNEKKQLIGEKILLLDEHMFGDDYSHIEGPHIYKLKSGEYMLMIASGGTGNNNHNVSVFKSDKPTGPYKPAPSNPVLTHRGKDSPFNNIGHADIVETQNGQWYAVMLGVRKLENKTLMDRETFLTEFVWEDGWPVFNPKGNGMVLLKDKRPNLPWTLVPPTPARDEFHTEQLGLEWNFYHTPHKKWWSLTERPGHLRIYLQKPDPAQQTNTPVIARRITQFSYTAATQIDFNPQGYESAGLIALMNQNGMFRLELFNDKNGRQVRLVKYSFPKRNQGKRINEIVDTVKVSNQPIGLIVEAEGFDYRFYVADNNVRKRIGKVEDGRIISKQLARGYMGAYVGVFATSNSTESKNYADFDWFTYQPE